MTPSEVKLQVKMSLETFIRWQNADTNMSHALLWRPEWLDLLYLKVQADVTKSKQQKMCSCCRKWKKLVYFCNEIFLLFTYFRKMIRTISQSPSSSNKLCCWTNSPKKSLLLTLPFNWDCTCLFYIIYYYSFILNFLLVFNLFLLYWCILPTCVFLNVFM